jgi:CRP-like cAMP-binding protein
MQTPAFFDQVPPIVVHDALAQTLGAAHDGVIEYRYLESLVNEFDRQASGSGRARLVGYLVRRAGNGAGPRLVTLPATKAAVASRLNLTPEHFSRLLHELAASGLLQVEGRHIRVPDVQRLAGVA